MTLLVIFIGNDNGSWTEYFAQVVFIDQADYLYSSDVRILTNSLRCLNRWNSEVSYMLYFEYQGI